MLMPSTIQELRRYERTSTDYSAEVSNQTADEIQSDALEAARLFLRSSQDELFPIAESPDLQLLRHLGVVDGDGQLLRVGAALFCDSGNDHPWIVYQYTPTPGAEASLVERLGGPLITVLERLLELVRARRQTMPITLSDGRQIETADFPLEAVREAVANGLLHRELRIERPVDVQHSPEIFVVESPGRLVPGITEHNIITHPSKPRNLCLFGAARKLRIAEDTGRGVDRIYRELLRAGKGTPHISQSEDTTRIAFVSSQNERMAKYIAQLDSTIRDDVDTLLVIFTMLQTRTVTAESLAPVLQEQADEVATVLRRIAADDIGILEPTQGSRNQCDVTYRLRPSVLTELGSAVRYQKPQLLDIDRKIVTHLRDYGRINNRSVRDLFDVDVHRASAILRDLRERGYIVKASEQQRGPSVVYQPGPKLPRRG